LKLLWARWGIRQKLQKSYSNFVWRFVSNYNEPQFVKVDDVAPLPPETVLKL
jgi:hypothetical protein